MMYLIFQILICLVIAFIIGLIIGYLLGSMMSGSAEVDTSGIEMERDSAKKDATEARGLLSAASAKADASDKEVGTLTAALAAMTAERDAAVSAGSNSADLEQLTLKHDVLVQRLQEAEKALSDCKDRCNDLRVANDQASSDDGALTAAQARISELEGNLTSCNSRVAELEGANTEATGRIGVLEAAAAAAAAGGAVGLVSGDDEADDGKLAELEAKNTELEGIIAGLRTELAAFAPVDPDNLKKVEGIGPKIEGLLNKNGILTFRQLAAADVDDLKEYVMQGGKHMKVHDPKTWPEQARLAADGLWDELKKWQDELSGGK